METAWAFLRAALPWLTIGLLYAVLFAVRARMKKGKEYAVDCGAEGMSLGIGLGLCLEVSFGNNSGMGIAIGMLIGLAIGTGIKRDACGETSDEA